MTGKLETARMASPAYRTGRTDGQCYRPKTPGTVSIWNPTGCYTMTEGRGPGGRQWRKPKATTRLRGGSLPVWMLHRISGK